MTESCGNKTVMVIQECFNHISENYPYNSIDIERYVSDTKSKTATEVSGLHYRLKRALKGVYTNTDLESECPTKLVSSSDINKRLGNKPKSSNAINMTVKTNIAFRGKKWTKLKMAEKKTALFAYVDYVGKRDKMSLEHKRSLRQKILLGINSRKLMKNDAIKWNIKKGAVEDIY